MKEPKKGSRVVIVEGAEQGIEGRLEGVYRYYDTAAATSRKMCTIRVAEEDRIVRTRLAWIRQIVTATQGADAHEKQAHYD